jgi:hypothetical protein
VPITNVFTRIAEIEALVQRLTSPTTPAPSGFDATLASASAVEGSTATPLTPAGAFLPPTVGLQPASGAGPAALAVAGLELGQGEEPPGSNDGARIGVYRSAVAGAYQGAPWCGYFVSWAAAQAGAPIGFQGEGLGSVEGIEAWARATGRLLPAGVQPQPGDLILYGGRHIGIVESVNPDGSLTTIEGNHNERVERVHRSRAEATGFVRL